MAAGHGPTTTVPEDAGVSSERLDRLESFQRAMVEGERLPCTHLVVSRRGKTVYNRFTGQRAPGVAVSGDEIYRMYSMTKPVVSVALMQLVEEGRLQLTDPVWKHLGDRWQKRNMSVLVPGSYDDVTGRFRTVPCEKTITVRMVLTHTSGLSYGFDAEGVANKVDLLYSKEKLSKIDNLRGFCDALAQMPLLFQPSQCWWYGFNTDVVGAIVEAVTGEPLEANCQRRILQPLGMRDTSFWVPPEKRSRVPRMYMRAGQRAGMLALGASKGDDRGLFDITDRAWKSEGVHLAHWADAPDGRFFSGGSGLAGTVSDYLRFAQCMMNGGELDGARVLSRKSVQTMVSNQIGRTPHGEPVDLRSKQASLPLSSYAEVGEPGTGFGLGFAVVLRADLSGYMASEGSFCWGGAGSTLFWCDPKEELVVVFATQFRFRDDFQLPLRATLANLVYGSLVDGDARGGDRRWVPASRL